MKKTNIRSIRFSDELAELIDRQVGDTFTARFESLVTRCVWELPEKERQLAELDKQIQEKRQELKKLAEKAVEISYSLRRAQGLTSDVITEIARLIKEKEN